MSIGLWYWVILVFWILLSCASWYWSDPRISRAGNVILIVLLILNGLMDAGNPIK